MMDWFTSDLHLGHEFCAKDRGFSSVDEMNERIFSMFDCVNKGDRVFILGDVSWDVENARKLVDMFIHKYRADVFFIEGNHDYVWWGKLEAHPRVHYCQTMTVGKQKNGWNELFLSHYPQMIFNKSHYGSYQLHGHGHSHTSDRPLLDSLIMGKRLNVNCELHDYELWERGEIEEKMKELPQNIDYWLCKGSESQKTMAVETLEKIHSLLSEFNEKVKRT